MADTTTERMRTWQGPALFSHGFRPFFLFGAVWVVLAMLLWVPALSGALTLPTRLDPVAWHAHEFLFGYLGAVLAGFLLTAVPNWTGRLPLVGWPLAGLFALWLAGRAAILTGALLPAGLAPLVDLAFPLVLGAVILREIVAGRNWRNLMVLGLLAAFTLANGVFHHEAAQGAPAAQGSGLRLGLATAIMMIALIGGRIVPSFTRNWLAQQGSPHRPVPTMQRLDGLVLLASVAILLLWVVLPTARPTGAALLVLGGLHAVRLSRWQGHKTGAEPLVWVLHLAYGFIPLGAAVLGGAVLAGASWTTAAQHLWMVGAVGGMTLAVMTRATLGHTGRALRADRMTLVMYLAVFTAAAARLGAGPYPLLTHVSAGLWLLAFGGFVATYGPYLSCPKAKG